MSPHLPRTLALAALALFACTGVPPQLPQAPTIALSAERLSFAMPATGPVESQEVAVRNAGPGALAVPVPSVVYAAYDRVPGSPPGWLDARVTASGDGYLLAVQPAVSADDCWLRAGDYVATVVLDVPGAVNSPRTIQVSLHVPPPQVAAVPAALSFSAPLDGSEPSPQGFTARSRFGLSRPAVAAFGVPAWLLVTAADDPARLDATVVSVRVLASLLLPGSYTATFTVYAPDGSSGQVVQVNAVVPGPSWQLEPAELQLVTPGGVSPPQATIHFADLGRRLPIGPTFTPSVPWLTVTRVTGVWPSMQVEVAAQTATFLPGTYRASIDVAMEGTFGGVPWRGGALVPVTVEVLPYALALSDNVVAFYATPSGQPLPQTVSVANQSPYAMPAPTAAVVDGTGGHWLSATVDPGSYPYGLELRANPAGLARGTYQATVELEAGFSGRASLTAFLTVADWALTRPMAIQRSSASATLLPDGRVWVVGGTHQASPGNIFLTETTEIYDPATDAWASAIPVASPRASPEVVLLPDGKVMVVGGVGDGITTFPLGDYQVFDLATGQVSAAARLQLSRPHPTVTPLGGGRVLVAGAGSSEVIGQGVAPALLATMALRREQAAAVRLRSGKVLVAGGVDEFRLPLASAELYDPALDRWVAAGSMGRQRAGHALVLLPDGRALAVGGFDAAPHKTAEVYDEGTDQWTPVAAPAHDHGGPAAVLPSGKVLFAPMAGGEPEVFDPVAGSWSSPGPTLVPRNGPAVVVLPDGRPLLVGGDDALSGAGSAELHEVIP